MKRVWLVIGLTFLIIAGVVYIGGSGVKTEEVSSVEQIQASATSDEPVVQLSASGPRPYHKLIQDAPVVAQSEKKEQQRIVRKTIYETDAKYPLILVDEIFELNTAGEEKMVKGTAMVANHVMARFPANTTESEVQQWVSKHGYSLLKKLRTTDLWLVQTSDTDVEALDRLLSACNTESPTKDIIIAEPDYLFHFSAMPNDPNFSSLWGMHNTGQNGFADSDIDALEAWDIATGSRQVVVGLIDSGIDYNHPDLADNIWVNPGEVPDNGIDDDNNGFIDDVRGWDFYAEDNDPSDQVGHGTHCAGTIGATGNNNIGVVGVNWAVSIAALKAGDTHGLYTSDTVEAINYATMMKMDLTSNSWGGNNESIELRNAISSAGASNILFVAGAGNDNADNDITPFYPSSYDLDCVIAVAASNPYDNKAMFSCYGLESVDLAAPGVLINSTLPGASYGYYSGTSMATPHVSGAVALMRSRAPEMDIAMMKRLLIDHVDALPDFADICVSGGRLNLQKIIEQIREPVVVLLPAGATEGDGVLTNGCTVLLPEAMASNVVIGLTSSDTSELLVPSNVVVLAGTTSAVFSVEILDDSLLDGSQEVEVSAYLDRYPSDNAIMLVHDTETAVLELTLPVYTFEGGPPFSGSVTVNTAPDENVRVFLESADPTEILSGSVVIPAGETAAVFQLQAYDDLLFDGAQSATITAYVENWTSDAGSILVYDNEDARLDIQILASAFEGEGVLTNGGVVSVPGIVTSDVQVMLSSSDITEATVPSSVTITQGGSSASFDITIVDDTELDGRQHLSITGTSPGFILGVDAMDVADNDVDHFNFGPIEAQQLGGVAFPLTLTAVNVDNEAIGNFTGPVAFDAVGDAGVLPTDPDALQGFVNGQWSGDIAVNAVGYNVVLIADDGAGTLGTSTVFSVLGPQISIVSDALTNTLVTAGQSNIHTMIIYSTGTSDLEFEFLDDISSTNITTYYPSISTNGLEANYPFSGNANDESGNEHHGSVSGARLTSDRFGNSNSAYYFNGLNNVVNMGDVLDRGTNDWTCSVWIRTQNYNQDSAIISKGLVSMGTPPHSGFGMYVLGDTRPEETLRFTIGTDASGIVGHAEYPLSALPGNEYIFLTGVYERGPTSAVIRLYMNGVQVASNSVSSGDSNSNLPLTIGATFLDSQSYFRGDIDDVRMYSRALSTSDILKLYNDSNPNDNNTWLFANPLSGTVPAGESIPVTVTFDAEGMAAGDHISGVLKISCNDRSSPTNSIPVSMWVLPSTPMMLEEPGYTSGFSNEVSWTAVRGPVDYLVESATSTFSAPDQQSGWIPFRNHTFEGLNANTPYIYRVKASVLSDIGRLEGRWSDWVRSVQEADLGDADNDSLPNWWEETYFGGVSNCNPLLDHDGDGLINLHEYISGMNPTNAWSTFMVEGIDTSIEGTFEIWWDSVAGRVYSVYWKENMTNSFQLLESDIRHPQNSYIDWIHSPEETGFYTIDVKLEE